MNQSEFRTLVAKAEAMAHEQPRRYMLSLACYAALGYLVIVVALAALIGIVGGAVWVALFSTALFVFILKSKLIFVLVPLAWMLFRALWVKLEGPEGYRISARDFPALFEELDSLERELKTGKVHSVLLTADFNAGMAQTPRLGLFGWHRNTLLIGLELLMTLSPAQARAVIAHELGHMSGNHGVFSGWIYRVRLSWARISDSLEHHAAFGARVLGRFFGWYSPRFAAFSFALARRNEFEADAVAASLTSPVDAGNALVSVHVKSAYLDENYWRNFFKRADDVPRPEHMPWESLSDYLESRETRDLEPDLARALKYRSDVDDTHPSLSDRLRALDHMPCIPGHPNQSAARAWLGERLALVISDFDQQWYEGIKDRWSERYEYAQASRKRLAELNDRHLVELNDEELWERVILSEQFAGKNETLDALADYERSNPADPDAAFVHGRLLFDAGDSRCLEYFSKALPGRGVCLDACEYAYQFLHQQGDSDEAGRWRDRADELSVEIEKLVQEHQNLNVTDALVAADLASDEAREIVDALQKSKLVKKAWIAQKVLTENLGTTGLAVGVVMRGFYFDEDSAISKLAEEFGEFDAWFIPRIGNYKKLFRLIKKNGEQAI